MLATIVQFQPIYWRSSRYHVCDASVGVGVLTHFQMYYIKQSVEGNLRKTTSSAGSTDFYSPGHPRTLSHHSINGGNLTQWRGRGGDRETEGGKDQGGEVDRCYLSVSQVP